MSEGSICCGTSFRGAPLRAFHSAGTPTDPAAVSVSPTALSFLGLVICSSHEQLLCQRLMGNSHVKVCFFLSLESLAYKFQWLWLPDRRCNTSFSLFPFPQSFCPLSLLPLSAFLQHKQCPFYFYVSLFLLVMDLFFPQYPWFLGVVCLAGVVWFICLWPDIFF